MRLNSGTKSRQKFSFLLITVTFTALSRDLYFFKLTQPLIVNWERKKTWWKTIPLSLWCRKSIQNPQVWELSRLCPETSTKLYVHEFGFCTPRFIHPPGCTHSVGGLILIPKFNIPVLDLASFNGFSLSRRQILHLFGFQPSNPLLLFFVDTKPCNTAYTVKTRWSWILCYSGVVQIGRKLVLGVA